MGNAAQFSLDIDRFFDSVLPGKMLDLQKRIARQTLRGIVMATPVDTGRARGNWQVTIDAPATGTVDQIDPGGSSFDSLAAINSLATLAGSIWITNNLPYIQRLEDGWSKQAPAGMVAVTLQAIRSRYQVVREPGEVTE